MDSQSTLLELTFRNPVIQNRTSTTVQDPASLFLGAPMASAGDEYAAALSISSSQSTGASSMPRGPSSPRSDPASGAPSCSEV